MFSIFKKKNSGQVDFSQLRTDMHSHLLPGIDDGSKDTLMSMQLIQGLHELGFTNLITTPHIMWDMFKNTPETIGHAEQWLSIALKENNRECQLRSAAEYYLDDHFEHLLQNDMPLLTVHENKVLIEFSFVSPPIEVKRTLFEMQMKGYQPILAHPERYGYVINHKNLYDEWKGAGCLFQVNILSLAGYYGKVALELARYLIKKNYVNLLGTDLHHERHLAALRSSSQLMTPIQALLDSGQLLNPTF